MAGVNKYFQFSEVGNKLEQKLLDSLIRESIRNMGQNCLFIPRNLTNVDPIYGTDTMSSYTDTYLIEVYLKNATGFQGDKTFMSKFGGLEIRDQVVFVVSQSAFQDIVTPYTNNVRPLEGDIFFWPFNNKCFQIKFVNPFVMFYPLGSLYVFECTCELFEYSSEIFNTGIPEIDILQQKFSTNALDYAIMDENGEQLCTENDEILVREQYVMEIIDPTVSNEAIKKTGSGFIDFSESDPYSMGNL